MAKQKNLSVDQINQFKIYHGSEVNYQQFCAVIMKLDEPIKNVLDVGGGVGYFAHDVIDKLGLDCVVLDYDEDSVNQCNKMGITAYVDDALDVAYEGNPDIVSFNLMLHHLVGYTEDDTLKMQMRALEQWKGRARYIFVHELSYESCLWESVSGKLIWLITSNKLLSKMGSLISRWVPSLRANTFGIGVRFRAHNEWVECFRLAGMQLVEAHKGNESDIPFARRLLLIKSIRLDSFLLRAG